MTTSSKAPVSLALVHHPVVNRNGDIIASAVTNLDLHDLARLARTYGIRAVYVVTPLTDQQALVEELLDHWTRGHGAVFNPMRKSALELITVVDSIDDAVADVQRGHPAGVTTIATCARRINGAVGFQTMRQRLAGGGAHLLLLGTAWGLAPEVIASAGAILEPVTGTGDYNHLSVRAAAAIILDRLMHPAPGWTEADDDG